MEPPPVGDRGASLLEAVVAAGLLAGVFAGLLPLTTAAWAATASSRLDLQAVQLARQRLEQLQTLTHVRGPGGTRADLSSRLDAEDFVGGGAGLTATGVTPLEAPMAGWSDWLDGQGRLLPWDSSPPEAARYGRRWAVVAVSGSGCLRIWVSVAPLRRPARPRVVELGALQCPWGVDAP